MKIGIMTRTDHLDGKTRSFVNQTYIQKVLSFCHTPILLYGNGYEEETAEFCDALILPGGYDTAAFYFHDKLHEKAHLYEDATMDIRDFAILDAFIKKRKPVLGICRGIQIINVYFHGTLHQDIALAKHETHVHEHRLEIVSDAALSTCLTNRETVNSYHHQAIHTLGNHLLVQAYAQDHIIEAVAHDTLPIIGVQWHPELMDHDLIFPYFFHLLTGTLF